MQTDSGSGGRKLEDGTALCLSGGGYRAALFHLGGLWRLNDAGYLPHLARISSVSGGSIAAAVLANGWKHLSFGVDEVAHDFAREVAEPLIRATGRTMDVPAAIEGLLPGLHSGNRLAAQYARRLFGSRTLQDLPDVPRFVFNATNLQSGALWRFSKPYMGDYRTGRVSHPTILLSVAVAASSAFPPFLSPVVLDLKPVQFDLPGSGSVAERFLRRIILSDGGVYDNLGLEPAWQRYTTLLVSDGGGGLRTQDRVARDWPRQVHRTIFVIDNQVRSLRKRQVVGLLSSGSRKGAYWGIGTRIEDYGLTDILTVDPRIAQQLARLPTRLAALPLITRQRLANWGYAIADAALRRYFLTHLQPPPAFPYPNVSMTNESMAL